MAPLASSKKFSALGKAPGFAVFWLLIGKIIIVILPKAPRVSSPRDEVENG